jgi:putative ABC transport system permease protein
LRSLRAWFAVAHAVTRGLLARPWTAVVALAGVSLGTAVVVAIDVTSFSAEAEHERALRLAAGGASHQVLGGAAGVPEHLYGELAQSPEVSAAGASLVREVTLPGHAQMRVVWRGVDLLSELGWSATLADLGREQVVRLLTDRRAVVVGGALASELGLQPAASLTVSSAGREHTLVVGAVVEGAAALERVLVSDIATVQLLAGRLGFVDRIDIKTASPAALTQHLSAHGARLVQVSRQIEQQQSLTSAFKTNLRMMGLLALLVGLLLVYNAQSFSIVQRRQRLGVLRALGVTRAELALAILVEAVVLGLGAAVVGLVVGVALATLLLGAVEQTLNDLYFPVSVERVTLSAALQLKALLLAVGGAVVSSVPGALEAAAAPPATVLRRSTLESKSRSAQRWLALTSGLLALSAPLLLALPEGGLAAGYAALFAIVLAAILLVPCLWQLMLDVAAGFARTARLSLLAVAVSTMRAAASRSAVAVAALTVALAATIGVDTMVGSFRMSVADWLEQTLRADLYVSEPGAPARAKLAPALIDVVSSNQYVAAMSLGRSAKVQARHGQVAVVALDLAAPGRAGFKLLDGMAPDRVWGAFTGGGVLVSETYAYKNGVARGDTLELLVANGWRTFAVLSVYRDYSRENGVVLMDGQTYRDAWGDTGASSLGIYLKPSAPVALAFAAIEAHARRFGVSAIRSGQLRQRSLRIFDRTFVITEVLRSVTIVVAFAGVLSVLLALQLDRAREVALLRASGTTRCEIGLNVLSQTVLLGGAAGLLAVPLGAAIGYLLVDVINTRSFGWTLDFIWQPTVALEALLVSLAAAVFAGIYPAVRLAAAPVAAGLRYE